jgi:predicted negative regulator of RcsB-dependent stress response
MTRTGAAARPPIEHRTESAFDWAQSHVREVVIGVIAIATLVGGGWLYLRSREMRAERAEKAYYEAQQALASGNTGLARTELQKVQTRYDGTTAAQQATIVLAQLLYDEKKYADGIKHLEAAADERSAEPFRSAIYGLIGAGHEEQDKFGDAAKAYERAAAAAEFENDRNQMKASAARAYMRANQNDAARRLWTELSQDQTSPFSGEARVRLGELDAKPAVPSR